MRTQSRLFVCLTAEQIILHSYFNIATTFGILKCTPKVGQSTALSDVRGAFRWAPSLRDLRGFSPLFSARTAYPAGDIRQDYPLPFRCSDKKYLAKNCSAPQGMQFLRKTRRRGRIILTDIRPLQRGISQISAPLRHANPYVRAPFCHNLSSASYDGVKELVV